MDWGSSIPEFLANAAIRSLGLALVAGVLLWVLRVRSAAARHAAWTLVLAAMLVTPALERWLPSIPLRLLRADSQPVTAGAEAMDAPAVTVSHAPLRNLMAPVRIAKPPAAPAPRSIPWRQVGVVLYLSGVLMSLVLLAYSYRAVRRLVRTSRSVERPEWNDVFESNRIAAPVTVGFWRPKILLPRGWSEWPAEKLEAAMVHERAHVGRGDWAVAVMAAMNRCLFWFHPLAWWLERELSALSEQAADDAALLTLGGRISYAQTLLEMAAAVRADRGRVVKEAIAMAKTAEVRKRIERILDETRGIPRGLTRARWIALAVGSLPLVYVAAAVQVTRATTASTPLPVMAAAATAAAITIEPAASVPVPVAPAPAAVSAPVPASPVFAVQGPVAPAQSYPQATFAESLWAGAQAPYAMRAINFGNLSVDQKVEPLYPAQAMAEGIEGDVRVRVVAGQDGRVRMAEPMSGDPILAEAAVAAVRQWTFSSSRMTASGWEQEGSVMVPFRLHPSTAPAPVGPAPPLVTASASHVARPGFFPPVLVYKFEPEYPLTLRAAGIQGTVVLSFSVDVQGLPQRVQVTQSVNPSLDANAMASLVKWKFAPAKQDGVPVEAPAIAEVRFQLRSDTSATLTTNAPARQAAAAGAVPPQGDSLPRVLSETNAEYTAEARKAKRSGPIAIDVLVGADGGVRTVRVPQTVGLGLDERAMAAVMMWQFLPAYRNGKPVDFWTSVQVYFE